MWIQGKRPPRRRGQQPVWCRNIGFQDFKPVGAVLISDFQLALQGLKELWLAA